MLHTHVLFLYYSLVVFVNGGTPDRSSIELLITYLRVELGNKTRKITRTKKNVKIEFLIAMLEFASLYSRMKEILQKVILAL